MGDDAEFVPDYKEDESDNEKADESIECGSQASTDRAVPKSRGMVQERFYVGEAAQLNKC